MIEQTTTLYYSQSNTLDVLDYSTLSNLYNHHQDGFIQYKELNFKAQTGCAYLTGNDLLHYPQLAKILCNTPSYPMFRKSYAVAEELRSLSGIPFLSAFLEFSKQCDQDFRSAAAVINAKVSNLIHLYGAEKTKPIINEVMIRDNGYFYGLVINQVPFEFANYRVKDKENTCDMINLERLFDYRALGAEYLSLDAAILNTPYIALRIKKTWKHAGRVIWYNLDKMKIMTTAEINAIKRAGGNFEVKRERQK